MKRIPSVKAGAAVAAMLVPVTAAVRHEWRMSYGVAWGFAQHIDVPPRVV